MKSLDWVKRQVEECKSIPEVNSRYCFLGTSIVICLCVIILTIGVFYSDRVKDVYEGGIAVLLGGHGVSAWGRSKTKGDAGKDNGNGNGNGGDAPDPTPVIAAPAPATGSAGPKG